MSDCDIRVANETDLAAIDALEQAAFGEHRYPYFFFRQALDALGEFFFVAQAPEKSVAGYTVGCITAGTDRAWVLSAAVNECFRGRGIGRALVKRLLDVFIERSAAEVWLHVSPSNAPARALYEREGFRVNSSCTNYFGSGEDRLIMSLSLSDDNNSIPARTFR